MQSKSNTMIVNPCKRLAGDITVQGSKNSVLPIMAAAIINKGVTVINNCPAITDVYTMMALLRECGATVTYVDHVLMIDGKDIDNCEFSSEYSSNMRASILLMGGCLGRFGHFFIPHTGGCAIGSRPVDIHIGAMKLFGADVIEDEKGITGKVKGKNGDYYLSGNIINLPFPSVGATQNALIASMCAMGRSQIINAAIEPEIWDLCEYLRSLGAQIVGEKTGHIYINPVKREYNKDVYYELPADRIVAGTIMLACAGCTGNIYIPNIEYERIACVCKLLGARKTGDKGIIYLADKRKAFDTVISTGPFPDFPTDMQSQFLSLMAVGGCFGIMEENIFETRFLTAYELNKLGADIRIEGKCAYVYGRHTLKGGVVYATDLRGGAALVLAGLFADAKVTVKNCEHLHRGYENLALDLNKLGADIMYA